MARGRGGSSVPLECGWGWVEVDIKAWSGCVPLDPGGSVAQHPWELPWAVEPVLAACTPGTGRGEREQPFTATALLGSADRPGFTSVRSVQV